MKRLKEAMSHQTLKKNFFRKRLNPLNISMNFIDLDLQKYFSLMILAYSHR